LISLHRFIDNGKAITSTRKERLDTSNSADFRKLCRECNDKPHGNVLDNVDEMDTLLDSVLAVTQDLKK
jgi:hypothetical protein